MSDQSPPRLFGVPLPAGLAGNAEGLGDVIKKITSSVGIQPCGPCEERARALNRRFPVTREDGAPGGGGSAAGGAAGEGQDLEVSDERPVFGDPRARPLAAPVPLDQLMRSGPTGPDPRGGSDGMGCGCG